MTNAEIALLRTLIQEMFTLDTLSPPTGVGYEGIGVSTLRVGATLTDAEYDLLLRSRTNALKDALAQTDVDQLVSVVSANS